MYRQGRVEKAAMKAEYQGQSYDWYSFFACTPPFCKHSILEVPRLPLLSLLMKSLAPRTGCP